MTETANRVPIGAHPSIPEGKRERGCIKAAMLVLMARPGGMQSYDLHALLPDVVCQGCARWQATGAPRQAPPAVITLPSGIYCPWRIGN